MTWFKQRWRRLTENRVSLTGGLYNKCGTHVRFIQIYANATDHREKKFSELSKCSQTTVFLEDWSVTLNAFYQLHLCLSKYLSRNDWKVTSLDFTNISALSMASLFHFKKMTKKGKYFVTCESPKDERVCINELHYIKPWETLYHLSKTAVEHQENWITRLQRTRTLRMRG